MPARRSARQIAPLGHVTVIAAVVVGYVFAITWTPVGQGWQLLGHLAAEQHAEPVAGVATETWEATPEAAHTHASGERPHVHVRVTRVQPPAPLAPEARPGVHEHGGEMHSHEAPAPTPEGLLVITLDKHRLPPAAALPLRSSAPGSGFGAARGVLVSIDLSVETPPPLARG